jgi:hypothetical protein
VYTREYAEISMKNSGKILRKFTLEPVFGVGSELDLSLKFLRIFCDQNEISHLWSAGGGEVNNFPRSAATPKRNSDENSFYVRTHLPLWGT